MYGVTQTEESPVMSIDNTISYKMYTRMNVDHHHLWKEEQGMRNLPGQVQAIKFQKNLDGHSHTAGTQTMTERWVHRAIQSLLISPFAFQNFSPSEQVIHHSTPQQLLNGGVTLFRDCKLSLSCDKVLVHVLSCSSDEHSNTATRHHWSHVLLTILFLCPWAALKQGIDLHIQLWKPLEMPTVC